MYEEMHRFCLCHGSAGIFSTVEQLHAKILQSHSAQTPETGEALQASLRLHGKLLHIVAGASDWLAEPLDKLFRGDNPRAYMVV